MISADDETLTRLKETTGVDFASLKAKYAGAAAVAAPSASVPLADEQRKEQQPTLAAASPNGAPLRTAAETAQINQTLCMYRTCDECHGRGLVDSIYNFMRLTSNCTKCEGDGVFVLPQTKEVHIEKGIDEAAKFCKNKDTKHQ